jgi:hypothetical protein
MTLRQLGLGALIECRCVFSGELMMKWDPCCPKHIMPLMRK